MNYNERKNLLKKVLADLELLKVQSTEATGDYIGRAILDLEHAMDADFQN